MLWAFRLMAVLRAASVAAGAAFHFSSGVPRPADPPAGLAIERGAEPPRAAVIGFGQTSQAHPRLWTDLPPAADREAKVLGQQPALGVLDDAPTSGKRQPIHVHRRQAFFDLQPRGDLAREVHRLDVRVLILDAHLLVGEQDI